MLQKMFIQHWYIPFVADFVYAILLNKKYFTKNQKNN